VFTNLFWVFLLTQQLAHAPMITSEITAPALTESTASPVATDTAVVAQTGPEAPFALSVDGRAIPFRVMAAFALPGEALPLEVSSTDTAVQVVSESGTADAAGPHRWSWRAPLTPGLYPVRVIRGADEITLNVFVMIPYDRMKNGRIDGYRIGAYPSPARMRNGDYARPLGFVQVTAENQDALVTPHFALGQFQCKEGNGFPKYVVLQPDLLEKLENVVSAVQSHGFEVSTLRLMSAYRTPVYNKGIGNETTFSRHQYGDAADIIVDEFPKDGVMDDLNGNGREDRGDANLLAGWVETMDHDPETANLIGGLSAYGSTQGHGPFVHVDARGYAARW
jgi:hypothetical protein